MKAEDFVELASARRSIRKFQAKPVEPDLIERVLAAACQAPSAHNRQPWRYALVNSPESKAALAQALASRLRADRLADGDDPPRVEADAVRSIARISGAPVAILICLSMADMDRYPDHKRARAEFIMGVQSVAMAGQNLLLAAHAHGLGACWMCAPLFAPQIARETLGLPEDWEPQGLIVMGWPAEAGRERRRRPASELMVYA